MRNILRGAAAFLLAAAALLCGVFALFLEHSPVFREGKGYELYLAPSSSAEIIAGEKLLAGGIAGESVRYDGDCAAEIMERFGARLLFTEEACGVVNYYLWSPMLRGGVELYGRTVNLHIAVSDTQTAAGTPLIFGGF